MAVVMDVRAALIYPTAPFFQQVHTADVQRDEGEADSFLSGFE